MEELPRKPSKLPYWLAVFIQKYLWITALAIAFMPLIIMATLDFDTRGTEWVLFVIFGGVLLLVIDVCVLKRSGVGSDGRETRSYVLDDNEYDMTTPRLYTSLGYNWYILVASNFKKKNIIDEFRYKDGIIYVRTRTGLEYEAPLWETKFGYNLYKGGYGGDVFIYLLESKDGQKINFSNAPGVFEEDEFEDIFNILIRGEFVGQSKKTKVLNFITNLFTDVSSIGSNLSANDLLDSVQGKLAEKAKMKVLGNYTILPAEQLKGILTGEPQSTSQPETKNEVSSEPSSTIIEDEPSNSKRKYVYIILGIIAVVAIVAGCFFVFSDDKDYKQEYYEEEYVVGNGGETHSETVVVDRYGNIVGIYVATNEETYTACSQDVFEVPKNGHHLITISAENGEGYLMYNKDVIVRKEPSVSSKPVGQIEYWEGYINDPIPCLGYEKGWYKVEVNGEIGYVSEDDVEWISINTF